MKIGKLKRKLRNPKFVKKLLDKFMAEEKQWRNFHCFKCSSFLVGVETARFNKIIYNSKAPRVAKKIRFLKKLYLKDYDFVKGKIKR